MKIINHLFLIIFLLLQFFPSFSEDKVFNVMAPLHVRIYNNPQEDEEKDWQDFGKQMKIVKDIGGEAVSTDVWWGLVEGNSDNTFDWSYYKKVVQKIKEAGLAWVPIMSFHQCGGNVGDDYIQKIPTWVWGKLIKQFNTFQSELDLKYVSEATDQEGNHKYSDEYVALWADDYVMHQYIEFMEAFETEFKEYAGITVSINISCGPSGELRYPSYNSHDWGGYPNRGTLQCYSSLARKDFRKWIADKYGTIDAVNKAWNTQLEDFSRVGPPDNPDDFFTNGDYKNLQYGRDFIGWYNRSLAVHGNRMLMAGLKVFSEGSFSEVPISIKIPGVHWQIMNPQMPRVAEITAGLIDSLPLDLEKGIGYLHTLDTVITKEIREEVILYFTCLEMGNEYSGTGPSENYSRAKDLVFWVGDAADHLGITIEGENALAGNLASNYAWENIENALKNSHYSGITILRIANVVSGVGYQGYKALIKTYDQ